MAAVGPSPGLLGCPPPDRTPPRQEPQAPRPHWSGDAGAGGGARLGLGGFQGPSREAPKTCGSALRAELSALGAGLPPLQPGKAGAPGVLLLLPWKQAGEPRALMTAFFL